MKYVCFLFVILFTTLQFSTTIVQVIGDCTCKKECIEIQDEEDETCDDCGTSKNIKSLFVMNSDKDLFFNFKLDKNNNSFFYFSSEYNTTNTISIIPPKQV